MSWMQWYVSLQKPAWTPTPETISVIWQILYPIIFFSFSYVFLKASREKLPWSAALPFAINLIANLAFPPILFGLRSLVLASFDIVLVLATLVWGIGMIWRYHRWVAIVQVPYLIWVAIATALQLVIMQMNILSP